MLWCCRQCGVEHWGEEKPQECIACGYTAFDASEPEDNYDYDYFDEADEELGPNQCESCGCGLVPLSFNKKG